MSNELTSPTNAKCTPVYRVRLKGHLGPEWADWFGNLSIMPQANGETLVNGPALDQAALHGLLKKVRDSGLTLISVNLVENIGNEDRKGEG